MLDDKFRETYPVIAERVDSLKLRYNQLKDDINNQRIEYAVKLRRILESYTMKQILNKYGSSGRSGLDRESLIASVIEAETKYLKIDEETQQELNSINMELYLIGAAYNHSGRAETARSRMIERLNKHSGLLDSFDFQDMFEAVKEQKEGMFYLNILRIMNNNKDCSYSKAQEQMRIEANNHWPSNSSGIGHQCFHTAETHGVLAFVRESSRYI